MQQWMFNANTQILIYIEMVKLNTAGISNLSLLIYICIPSALTKSNYVPRSQMIKNNWTSLFHLNDCGKGQNARYENGGDRKLDID